MSEDLKPSVTPADAPASADRTADEARREVLKRLGVYGAFAAPALLTVLSSKASAQVFIDSGGTGDKRPKPPGEPQS